MKAFESVIFLHCNNMKASFVINNFPKFFVIGLLCVFSFGVCANTATIKETIVSIDTYPFSDPNPIPSEKEKSFIYPYHKFDGYEVKSQPQDWKVVTLENDYIKVFVLPEVGGKIWGAVEKSTGKEFIYKNKVIKFRNIALRGPWVSGGIEFNFGFIGHTPTGATNVDYKLIENEDGSVSCVVGAMDLTSRTKWQVKITLAKDKAYFETESSWYNPTQFTQSYYNWMNAAAKAQDDLELFFPGTQYLDHNGESHQWPISKEGVNLAKYNENNFEGHKSYHVVGTFDNYFGGYYQNEKFGFGHSANYSDMPGQKVWLWSQARSGGIWEGLLTDQDGQYIEIQSGRQFNQHSADDNVNSLTKVGFQPHSYDHWKEKWFPIKEIGGLNAVTEKASFFIKNAENSSSVAINALAMIDDRLTVFQNGKKIQDIAVKLMPMEVLKTNFKAQKGELVVKLGRETIYSTVQQKAKELKREFIADKSQFSESDLKLKAANDLFVSRHYDSALKLYTELEKTDHCKVNCQLTMAEILIRKNNIDKAFTYVSKVTSLYTYHSKANFIAGIAYKAKGDKINALESFGWAARDTAFRSVANALIAEIMISEGQFSKARNYIDVALEYNRNNIKALTFSAYVLRKENNVQAAQKVIEKILTIDAFNLFALNEAAHLGFKFSAHSIKLENEFRAQSILEASINYYHLNDNVEAVSLIKSSKHSSSLNLIWLSYLLKDTSPDESAKLLHQASKERIDFVFPYRLEMLDALTWAQKQHSSWKFKFYLALNHYAIDNYDLAKKLFADIGTTSNSPLYYQIKAKLFSSVATVTRLESLEKSLSLEHSNWRAIVSTLNEYLNSAQAGKALDLAEKEIKNYSENQHVVLAVSKVYLLTEQKQKALDLLKMVKILPYEHSYESRELLEVLYLFQALDNIKQGDLDKANALISKSMEWPENLGVGEPYDYDRRKQWALLAILAEKSGDKANKEKYLKQVVEQLTKPNSSRSESDVLSLALLSIIGQKRWLALNESATTTWFKEVLMLDSNSTLSTPPTEFMKNIKRKLIFEINLLITKEFE